MSFLVSPVLGWYSELSCPRTIPRKNPEDPVWLEPRTLDYESNTLPLSHARPRFRSNEKMLSFHVKFVQTDRRTDGRTDRRTTVKQYAPDLRYGGIKR